MTQNGGNDLESLRRRVEMLERDNQRLREKVEPILGPDNPNFHPRIFMRVLQRNLFIAMSPMYVLTLLIPLIIIPKFGFANMFRGWRIGPIPIVDLGGMTSGFHGLGLGIIAVGGLSCGVIAIGGFAFGLIAFGGGSIGVIAVGGGSLGIIAIGGGACGLIAVGGGACGYYALGMRAYGKFVLALNRQDPEAVELFVRYMPRLRAAVTTAMPVIPLGNKL